MNGLDLTRFVPDRDGAGRVAEDQVDRTGFRRQAAKGGGQGGGQVRTRKPQRRHHPFAFANHGLGNGLSEDASLAACRRWFGANLGLGNGKGKQRGKTEADQFGLADLGGLRIAEAGEASTDGG